jgi:spore coat polysaccharide biosynthesis protein SpsF (cytidylyltransferase family)
LPGKHFLDIGSGMMVMQHVERRCRHFGMQPVFCVPAPEISEFDQWLGCTVYGGDPDNLEARLIECAIGLELKQFHHLDGDDPFFDETGIVSSMRALQQSNAARITPSYESQSGSGRMGTSYNLMQNAQGEGILVEEGRTAPWPQRLTLDYIEDYHLLLVVNRIVGGYMAPRWAVDDAFVRNPDLHKINWFRTAEWKDRQLGAVKKVM